LKKAIDIEPQSWYATEDAKRGALITGGSGLTGGLAGAALSGKGRRLKGAATGAGAGMGLAALALLTERYLNKE